MFFVYALLAFATVDFVGYLWHRFVQHEWWLGRWVARGHKDHHLLHYPAGKLRTLFPYSDSGDYLWYILGGLATAAFVGLDPSLSVIGAALVGWAYGLTVGWMHETFHRRDHWLNRYNWYRRLSKLHMIHHYAGSNFGIITFWMDRLFGTYHKRALKDAPMFPRA